MTMDCDRVEELLPWLLNGTLEDGERRQALEHLPGCARCRQALADSRAAWEIFAWHPPAAALVAYAADGAGAAGAAAETRAIEEHLAECPSCAAEMELVRTSRLLAEDGGERIAVLAPPGSGSTVRAIAAPLAPPGLTPPPSFRRGTAAAGRGWRQTALAASLVGLVALTGWFESARQLRTLALRTGSESRAGEPDRRQPGSPATAGAPAIESVDLVSELRPSEQRLRGPDGRPPVLHLSEGPVTLPLRGSRSTSYARYEIEVTDASGNRVLALPVRKHPVEAGDDLDEFDILLPRGVLAPGDYRIRLSGRDAADHADPLATYRVRVG
jgi:anti-sigma factor RsiW